MSAPSVERVQVTATYGAGPEGGNSAWVLPDAGVVVDPGPPGDTAFERLERGLADAGLAVADVEHVLVTHWHADHVGLAPRLAAAADATLSMHERDAPLVADYAVERERRVERDVSTLERWGFPEAHLDALRDADSRSPMPDSFPVNALADGDRVGPLTTRATPGHTAGHAAFVLTDSVAAATPTEVMVGDAALRTVTPNVGGGDTRQREPLAAYRGTLETLEAIATGDGDVGRALPGHGEAFDLGPRVAELRAHHRERAGLVHESLRGMDDDGDGGDGNAGTAADGATPWEIAEERFGDMTGYHVKFGAGEAYAHLRDLESLSLVERVDDDPLRYRPVDGDVRRTVDAAWGVQETH